jgi:general secretion pathway protein G
METNETEKQKKNKRDEGFSLIELMVVIAIIAMLATFVGVNMFDKIDEASITKARGQIYNFRTAIIEYKIKLKRMPTTEEGLDVLINNDTGKSFLDSKELPLDPWNNPYDYTLNSDGSFVIVSYGADGTEGGTDMNADISSDDATGSDN